MGTMSVVLLVLAVLAVGVFLRLRARPLPGIKMSSRYEWFWGSTRALIKTLIMEKQSAVDWVRTEFDINGWRAFGWAHLGGKQGITVVEPEDVKFILKDAFNDFEKGEEFVEVFKPLLGDGIFNSNGEKWKEQRVVASHMFNRRQLRERMSTVFGAHSQEMVQILEKNLKDGTPVDLQALMYHYTFDSINNVAFNRAVNSLKGNEADCEFQNAFDNIQYAVACRFIVPWWKLAGRLQLSEQERLLAKSKAVIDAYIEDVLADYYDEDDNIREERLEGDQTMTGLYLEHAKAEGQRYTRQFLRDMILNFVIAGRDTTGSALTSCIEFLCQHPEWQQKLKDEALACFNGNLQEGLTFDDLEGRSPVAEAVVMEAMRLHPPVPGNGKRSMKKVTFPSGVTIEAGVSVDWSPYATNRYKKLWGADADDFNPDRWISGRAKPDDYTYPTFNGGPRLCLGKNMAILEAKTALLTLCAHYRFSLAPGFQPKTINTITWQLDKAGLLVNVLPA